MYGLQISMCIFEFSFRLISLPEDVDLVWQRNSFQIIFVRRFKRLGQSGQSISTLIFKTIRWLLHHAEIPQRLLNTKTTIRAQIAESCNES